jgi:hypothetical protein
VVRLRRQGEASITNTDSSWARLMLSRRRSLLEHELRGLGARGLHEIVARVPLDGSLAGYGGGLERKRTPLDLEHAPF